MGKKKGHPFLGVSWRAHLRNKNLPEGAEERIWKLLLKAHRSARGICEYGEGGGTNRRKLRLQPKEIEVIK